MEWRAWITSAYESRGPDVRPGFHGGASPERIGKVEAELGVRLPDSLREMLAESDGVNELLKINGEWDEIGKVVWSCDELLDNIGEVRDFVGTVTGDPPPVVLPFAHAGVDGIVFAFFVGPDGVVDSTIHGWFPIDGEWRHVSASLEAHLRGWTV